ncbi:hypothetical protein [Megalodesulfovibrio gigas]|uniref:Uncharacterized protein n=1 Tax=Megalodesulfovibrio gigas (strain ATCC 19364 / DSM 1382 / NCIMB 9332 / VKM B-1759) TaxID=1121448 RepID=T2G9G1_MEGG1|nr:hypothetical protein [Megalodesulfovibrio gigas]AGW12814.1 hypothetical protein DGI_0926 [Megalodesulfovibrio gigas DSM 1382 = ATCC 19364]
MAKKPKSNPALHPPQPSDCMLLLVKGGPVPVFVKPTGYKRCAQPGVWCVQVFNGLQCCPGCNLLCQFPPSAGLIKGQQVLVVKEL